MAPHQACSCGGSDPLEAPLTLASLNERTFTAFRTEQISKSGPANTHFPACSNAPGSIEIVPKAVTSL